MQTTCQPYHVGAPAHVSTDPGLTLEMGEHSYIHDGKIRNPSGARTHVTIGKFCSIATDLTVIGYDHHVNWVTTFPFLDEAHRAQWPGTEGLPYPDGQAHGSNKNRGDVRVGNDVWIGYGVRLFKGIAIGDGAVIGACSLVNKPVEPYSIVAGIPARPIRKRFADKEIAFLQGIRWWDWPSNLINRYMGHLCSSCLSELEERLEADPDYQKLRAKAQAENFLAQADAAYARKDFEAACAALKQGLALSSDEVPMWVCLGNIQFQLGAFADSLESFQRAEALKPGDVDILVRVANSAERCQDAKLCEQTLERALELGPTNPDGLRLAIQHNLERGRYAEGAQRCCTLIRSNPNDLLVLLQLGKCLREIGDRASARWCYDRALELDPACAIARDSLQRLDAGPVILASPLPQRQSPAVPAVI